MQSTISIFIANIKNLTNEEFNEVAVYPCVLERDLILIPADCEEMLSEEDCYNKFRKIDINIGEDI